MSKYDPRVDDYIARSPDFAQPILESIREVVHDVCPEAEETMKWSSPVFMYHGGMMCGMATFREHCRFHFWKGALIVDANGRNVNDVIGILQKVSDLPPRRQLTSYIQRAMQLNDEGVTVAQTRPKKQEIAIPDDFLAALHLNPKSRKTFEEFSPSHRREYVEWIADAKLEETRRRRIETAVQWLAEGKARNWKYM